MPEINRYAYWQKALKGEDVPSSKDTMAGFYRHHWDRKDGGPTWHACAIWYDADGNPVMQAAYKRDLITDADEIYEKFGWLSRYPIPHDVYVSVVERGEPWPHLYETRMPMKPAGALWTKEIGAELLAKAQAKAAKKKIVDETPPAAIVQTQPDAPENERAVIGDNSGETQSLSADQQVLAQINDALDKFNDWLKKIGGKVESDEQEKIAAGYAREFKELRLTGEKAHKVEKVPVLEAGRLIDAKWKAVTNAATDAERKAYKSADDFIAERRRREREAGEKAQRKLIEARAAAPVGAVIVQQPVVVPQSSGGFKPKIVKTVVIDDIEAVKKYFISTGAGTDAAREWALRNGKDMQIPGTHVEDKEEARV